VLLIPLLFTLASSAAPAGGLLVIPPDRSTAVADPDLVGPPVEAPPPPPIGAPEDTSWVGEAVGDLLTRALARAGVAAIGREDRLRAQAALELPRLPLTRATSIRLAEAHSGTA